MSRPPNRRLYVGNLPRSTCEVDIREQFESFGPVTSIRLCKRGDFAHVEFRREEDAIVAHERFAEQPLHLHEHLIHIAYDTFTNSSNKAPDRRIFVSNIPVEAIERDLHETFAQFGAINSMRLIVEPDESTRRFAYLTFAEQGRLCPAHKLRPAS
ncbi:hypothetical protein C8R43DRAFT_672261 [Mycena crocata]|nr:hypothetical protein C8R43DRAFT_672261 [Mycena crocata]